MSDSRFLLQTLGGIVSVSSLGQIPSERADLVSIGSTVQSPELHPRIPVQLFSRLPRIGRRVLLGFALLHARNAGAQAPGLREIVSALPGHYVRITAPGGVVEGRVMYLADSNVTLLLPDSLSERAFRLDDIEQLELGHVRRGASALSTTLAGGALGAAAVIIADGHRRGASSITPLEIGFYIVPASIVGATVGHFVGRHLLAPYVDFVPIYRRISR